MADGCFSLSNVVLSDALESTGPMPIAHEMLIDRTNMAIDAILEWVSGMRSRKQISPATRNEIISEIASINATVLNSDVTTHLHVLFTALNDNWVRMQNGEYEKWCHGGCTDVK